MHRWLTMLAPALAVITVQQVVLPSTSKDGGYLSDLGIQELTPGLPTAVAAAGMALVHRANRVADLAQGELGLVPAAGGGAPGGPAVALPASPAGSPSEVEAP